MDEPDPIAELDQIYNNFVEGYKSLDIEGMEEIFAEIREFNQRLGEVVLREGGF